MKKVLVLALALLASPAWAQQVNCPTRPPGTNTNACASTAFVVGNSSFNPILGYLGIGDNIADALARWSGTRYPLVLMDRSVGWHLINDQTVSDFTVATAIDSFSNQMASFATNASFNGAFNYNHFAGFEDLFHFNGTGTLTNHWSFLSNPTYAGFGGIVVNRIGVDIADVIISPTPPTDTVIQNDIGISIAPLTKGTVSNLAIQTLGTTPSQFNGPVLGTKSGAGSVAAFVATNFSGGGYGFSVTGAAVDKGNWDIVANSGALLFRAINDANNSAANVMGFSRGTGTAVAQVSISPPLAIGGYLSLPAPTTKTVDYTLTDTDGSLILNGGATITLTLPSAVTYPGRLLTLKTIAAQTVVSASANVVPQAGGAAGTAILAATAGKWAQLQSDGTNWQIMMSN